MQIYGGYSCQVAVATLANALLARIGGTQELASLRAILIGCGQLEQLICDADGTTAASRELACSATDHAAAAFYSVWSRWNSHAPRRECQVNREIDALRARVTLLARVEDAVGSSKIPEGFAF